MKKQTEAGGYPTEIIYKYSRKAAAPTLLYLHGLGCSMNDFAAAHNRPELSDYSLLSFNFPGCGGSPYPENARLGIDDLAGITNQVIERLAVDRLAVIAHSMGGAVAVRFMETYPHKVTAFANVEGNLTGNGLFLSSKIAGQTRDQFAANGLQTIRRKFAGSDNLGEQAYARALESAAPEAVHDNAVSLVEHSQRGDLLPKFLDLEVPRLYMYGEQNRSGADHYRSQFEKHGVQMAEIPGSGHWPMHDNPDAFYGALGSFLRAAIAPAG